MILVLNCGSSTLKHRLYRVCEEGPVEVEGGTRSSVRDHETATCELLQALDASEVRAVGHRIVHGGQEFRRPTLLDEQALEKLEDLVELAPLHNGPALRAVRACTDVLGDAVPQVAVFDTSFHRTMPEHAASYALPLALQERHGIRRFGFHGLAHRWMAERWAAVTGHPLRGTRLITLQLGAGCSCCALRDGRSVDTTMGYTPAEGMMMATRSGDLDPTLPALLAEREGWNREELDELLNRRSGLLGVSGISGDMRRVMEAADAGEATAELAIEMFCHRARKTLGAYLAVLGGADAIVFGGGIGENAPEVRRRILADLEELGVRLDEDRNQAAMGEEARISENSSSVQVWVLPVREEDLIATDTLSCIENSSFDTKGRRP